MDCFLRTACLGITGCSQNALHLHTDLSGLNIPILQSIVQQWIETDLISLGLKRSMLRARPKWLTIVDCRGGPHLFPELSVKLPVRSDSDGTQLQSQDLGEGVRCISMSSRQPWGTHEQWRNKSNWWWLTPLISVVGSHTFDPIFLKGI